MVKHLLIKNYALIQNLEIEPSKELNIITGETGAGKSIMLGAIGLLLGNRADTKALFNENEKCIIEATFDISTYDLKALFEEQEIDYDANCIIRREINASGKSRAFINDTPVTLEILKKWGAYLMDIHSQHETLLLGNSDFQINIVDAYAKNASLLAEYKNLFREYRKKEATYKELVNTSSQAKKELDYNMFLLNELKEVGLMAGEQEGLEQELKLLENAEDIKIKLNSIVFCLSNSDGAVIPILKSSEKTLSQLAPFSKNLEGLFERMKGALIELKDICNELENEESTVELGQEQMEKIRDRLGKIYTFQKKHYVKSVEELIQIQEDLQKKVDKVVNLDDEILQLCKEVEKLKFELQNKAEILSKKRGEVIPVIKEEMESLLREVGMPNASIKINQSKIEPVTTGCDLINILFSANKGVQPQELKNAASGGEFSRLMLCIKYSLASKTSLPTIIFDEIDTGISGEVAIKVGKMMKQMSQKHQVISISHQPQIAAQGTAHYYVYKDNSTERTISKIKKLSTDERIFEIAQMIGGSKPSDTAIMNAKELLLMC